MNFSPDPQVDLALARLLDDAERHVREVGHFAERHLADHLPCEDGLARVCVSTAIRSGLLLQRAITTAFEFSADYVVASPFTVTLEDADNNSHRLELDIAAYRAADQCLFLLEVVRTYSNLSHSRRKTLARRLTEATQAVPAWADGQGWHCDRITPVIVTGEALGEFPSAEIPVVPLGRFRETFGVSASGTVNAALSYFTAGVHARLAGLGY